MGAGTKDADVGATVAGVASVANTKPPEMPEVGATVAGVASVATTRPPEMPTMGAAVLATIAGGAVTAGGPPPMIPDLPALPPPRPAPTGTDRYTLGDEIARGGMGRVVEATDTVLGRVVALKEALAFDADAMKRFQREIKITARLEHPSIVPVHDAGTMQNSHPFYVMRKISGRPLEELSGRTPKVEERLALIPHLVAAANAIAHAHERGIVHRDIKPANILVGDLGETIVIDWGLAKVIGEADEITADLGSHAAPEDVVKTRVGIVYGTPGFMSPEQLCGFPVDERCDVYALGATLYHVLALKPPHHAKTADAMMKAALAGRATPIRELVAGVPRELETIIDKALHPDPNLRYQDARSLAEDLSRFMAGQLVASHHYSRAEKLRRFVKKHRVPVIAIAAALVVLIVGGSLAFARIVRERDRADAEKQLAVERADQAALANARILVPTNPTLALALVRPLAGAYPRDVRDVAVAARAIGVPWAIPASPHTTSVDYARDGKSVLLGGDDGVVRVVDLATHATTVVAERKATVRARFADADRVVAIVADATLALVDRRAGTTREVVHAAAITDLETTGALAYFVDAGKTLWTLDVAAALKDPALRPTALATEEPVTEVSPSPDGRWVAVVGEHHLFLYDRAATTEPFREVVFGVTSDLAWDADGKHLAAQVDDHVLEVKMEPEPIIISRMPIGKRLGVAYTDKLYSLGELGVSLVVDGDAETRRQLPGSPLGLHHARDNTLVAASAANTIYVISHDGDHAIPIPIPAGERLDASPRSPYVVGAFPGRVLVWNLDDVQPRVVAELPPMSVAFAGNGHAIASFAESPTRWIDLATGQSTPVVGLDAATGLVTSSDGKRAVAFGDGKARVVGPLHPPIDLPALLGDVDRAGFLDATRAIVASPKGIAIYDTATGATTQLGTVAPRAFTWSQSAWVTATFEPHRVWRHAIAATTDASAELPATPTSPPVVLADGTVVVGIGPALWMWRTTGAPAKLGTLPKPVANVAPLTASATDKIVAFDGDGMTYLVELATGAISPVYELGSSQAAMAADGGLLVTLDHTRNLEVVDPSTKQHWILSEASGATFASPRISPDGNRVLATTADHLVLFSLDLPAPGATAAWLDHLSNARVEADNALVWR